MNERLEAIIGISVLLGWIRAGDGIARPSASVGDGVVLCSQDAVLMARFSPRGLGS